MTDYTYLAKQVVAAAVDARKAIDAVEQATQRIVRFDSYGWEQSQSAANADTAMSAAYAKFEAFYERANDLVTLAEQDND